ncbi:hypothetical protein PMAYCL1PPCAC_16625, partial [Pristionchus mayeri]
SKSLNRSPPLLMVPGLGASAAAFVQNPPDSSPAMLMADAGFDVFLLNYRGTRYGQRHAKLKPSEPAFWQFTLDDYSSKDARAVVDKVLNVTAQESLFWLGHSQGTSVGFMLLADNPEYNEKIRAMFALTPLGTGQYSSGLVLLTRHIYNLFRPLITLHRYFFGATFIEIPGQLMI